MSLNAIIIDDEDHARGALKKLLEWNCPEVKILAACDHVDAALEAIKTYQPQLIFLDIEMPEKNGFDLVRECDNISFHIIFTTAYDEFALQAFKVNAIAYLLKPIDEEELKMSVERVKKLEAKSISKEALLESISQINSQETKLNKIAIPTSEGMEFIRVDQILRCASESNYTHIYLTTGSRVLVSKTLKEIEYLLSKHNFFRVHSSHLVHLDHIEKYLNGRGGQVLMSNGEIIPVSRSKKAELLAIYR